MNNKNYQTKFVDIFIIYLYTNSHNYIYLQWFMSHCQEREKQMCSQVVLNCKTKIL